MNDPPITGIRRRCQEVDVVAQLAHNVGAGHDPYQDRSEFEAQREALHQAADVEDCGEFLLGEYGGGVDLLRSVDEERWRPRITSPSGTCLVDGAKGQKPASARLCVAGELVDGFRKSLEAGKEPGELFVPDLLREARVTPWRGLPTLLATTSPSFSCTDSLWLRPVGRLFGTIRTRRLAIIWRT